MKSQEEIKQLIYGCFGEKEWNNISTNAKLSLIEVYTKCQEDMTNKRYTEEDIKKAIQLARETESVRGGALSEGWDDVEKYDEMDILYLLNKS